MLPYKFIAIAIYLIVSVPLFHQVYQIAQLIIDEEFHLRQGEHYCHGRFEIVSFSAIVSIRWVNNMFFTLPITVGPQDNHLPGALPRLGCVALSIPAMRNVCIENDVVDCLGVQCLAHS